MGLRVCTNCADLRSFRVRICPKMWCRSLAEFPAQQSQAPNERLRKLSRPALTLKFGGLSETARRSSQCKFKSVVGPYAAFRRRSRARRPLAPRPRRARLEARSGVGAGAMVPDKPWKKTPPGSEAATPSRNSAATEADQSVGVSGCEIQN